VAEGRRAIRQLQLEYRFDRLVGEKLAQAYQLLVPERSAEIGAKSEVNDETNSHLCTGVVRTPKGAGDDRQSDSGSVGESQGAELGGSQRLAISG